MHKYPSYEPIRLPRMPSEAEPKSKFTLLKLAGGVLAAYGITELFPSVFDPYTQQLSNFACDASWAMQRFLYSSGNLIDRYTDSTLLPQLLYKAGEIGGHLMNLINCGG